MESKLLGFGWVRIAAIFAGLLAVAASGGSAARSQQQGSAPGNNMEAKTVSERSSFYCNLKELSAQERQRHHELTMKLASARLETKELADGYAFRLAGESVTLAELAEWVTAEKKCCPFFDFVVEAERDGGALWLKLRGREGVKAFIQSAFDIAR
jgi:hypothetical protein